MLFFFKTETAVLQHPQECSRIKTLLNELWGDELQHSVGSLVSAYRNFKKPINHYYHCMTHKKQL